MLFSYALLAIVTSVLATDAPYQHLLHNKDPRLIDGYWVRALPASDLPPSGFKDHRLLDAFRFNCDVHGDVRDPSSGVTRVSYVRLARDEKGNLQRPPASDTAGPGVFMYHGEYNSLTKKLPGNIPLKGYLGRSLAIFAPGLAGKNIDEIIETICTTEGVCSVRFLSVEEIKQQQFRTVQDQENLPTLAVFQTMHPLVRPKRKSKDESGGDRKRLGRNIIKPFKPRSQKAPKLSQNT